MKISQSIHNCSLCGKILIILLTVCFCVYKASAQKPSHLKAALILKLANSIRWPGESNINQYLVCYLGSDTVMSNALLFYSKTRKINAKTFIITTDESQFLNSQIVILDAQKSEQIDEFYTKIGTREIVLISENCADKKYIMLNLLSNNKITFEVNKANIVLQNLSYDPEILLIGGTEIDVRELYNSMRKLLQAEHERVNRQNDTIKNQVRAMLLNQQSLDVLHESIRELRSFTDQKESELKQLNARIAAQHTLFSQEALLSQAQKEQIHKQTNELRRRKLQISKQIASLRELQHINYERSMVIKSQNDAIRVKESLIATQKLLIWVFSFAGFLFLLLMLIAFVFYRNKRDANKVLEQRVSERTEQLQISNASLREEISERIAAERELEQHRNHPEQLVNDRTAELLCANQELTAINEQLIITNEELDNQRNQLLDALEKLQTAQAQLIQSEKMASLGFLTAGIAHEINNPLNYIKSGVEAHIVLQARLMTYMSEYQKLVYHYLNENHHPEFEVLHTTHNLEKINKQFAQCATNINNGVDRIVTIVKSLRLFSRADGNVLATVNVKDIIDSALVMFQNSNKVKITLHTAYPDIEVESYNEQIFQVIVNLLSNAIGASRHDGNVWIRSYQSSHNEVFIEITDDGIGMTDEVKRNVFEPFYTTKKAGEGTGLGLSLTTNIVKKHKGRIEFVSTYGVGTSFFVYWPIRQNNS